MNIAVLASHGGSILQAIIDACTAQRIPGHVSLVISNNSGAYALERARQHGIPTRHMSFQTHGDSDQLDRAMCDTLSASDAEWIMLAGYMKKLGPATLARFDHRILNVHPALLPEFGGLGFYGRRVHEAVLASGATESGATMHFVVGEYDTGPVIARTRVPVLEDDTSETLETRVKNAEQELVVNTLAGLATGARASNYL